MFVSLAALPREMLTSVIREVAKAVAPKAKVALPPAALSSICSCSNRKFPVMMIASFADE